GASRAVPPFASTAEGGPHEIDTRWAGSGLDFDRCAHAHQIPQVAPFFIRYRDASVGPIMQSMRLPDPRILLRKPVHHDVASRTDAQFPGGRLVVGVWIRHVEGFVIVAIGILRIEN